MSLSTVHGVRVTIESRRLYLKQHVPHVPPLVALFSTPLALFQRTSELLKNVQVLSSEVDE